MNLRTVGGTVFGSLRPSLGLQSASAGGSGGGWSFPSLKPVSALLHTMVPPGYTALQEERLAMVELNSPKLEAHQNGAHQNGFHREPSRRLSERSSRASLSLSDDGRYAETEPMLPDARLSGEEADEDEASDEEGQRPDTRNLPKESPLAMALQILVPFLLAGFGTVSAGMVLDIVQHWEAFKHITEIFILVPALLGLKGNLEMTLASRLSTAVNVGKMDSPIEKWNLIIGNLALKQVQATIVGFLAAVAAVILGWIPEGKFQMNHAVLLCSSSVATAFIASLLQGIIMVGVIVGSKKTGINPDNVATPIAASFGDLITLTILAWISQGLYNCLVLHQCPQDAAHRTLPTGRCPQDAAPQDAAPQDAAPQDAAPQERCPTGTLPHRNAAPQERCPTGTLPHRNAAPQERCPTGTLPHRTYSHPYVSSLVCAFFMCLTPVWMVISSKHPASRQLLYSGWEPVITAMLISSIGGLILDKTVSDPNLAGIVVYTPVINGIGGNLVAIQSSRISTHLHFHSSPGEVPDEAKGCYYPCRTFCGSGANHRSAQVLLLLVIPGHVIFLYTIHLMKSGHTTLTPIFMAVYLAAALLQSSLTEVRYEETGLQFAFEDRKRLRCSDAQTIWEPGQRRVWTLVLHVSSGMVGRVELYLKLEGLESFISAHRTLPTGRCPQDAAHGTLPTGRCPRDAAHGTLPTGRCPQDAAHRTLPAGQFFSPVFLLLCIADWMVHSMWRSGKDPDSFSIPYLTALGDLLGTALLALSFHFLWVIGDQDSDVGD
ncbi:hypothetical protein NFI96_018252 [Prochilodus magdalenae]|nr:hypothetical protein NFI96_018252 [Prochilodus magdalenae]